MRARYLSADRACRARSRDAFQTNDGMSRRERSSASSSAAAASPPCTGSPWPTSRCSGRNGLQPVGRQHAAQEVHARRAAADGVVRRGADRLRRPPARAARATTARAPSRAEAEVEHRERAVGQDVGQRRGAGRPGACAIASPSRGWAMNSCSTPAGSPSAVARSIASGASTGSTNQTRPSWTRACEARSSGSSTTQVRPSGCSSSSRMRIGMRPYPDSKGLAVRRRGCVRVMRVRPSNVVVLVWRSGRTRPRSARRSGAGPRGRR